MKVELNVNVHYWNKETNYLFDFNYTESEINNFKVKSSGNIIRNSNEIIFVTSLKAQQYLLNKYWTNLWLIQFYKDETSLILPEIQSDKTYVTIKHTFRNQESGSVGYKLKEGDSIKLGKMTLLCKEIKTYNAYDANASKAKEKTFADNDLNNLYNQLDVLNYGLNLEGVSNNQSGNNPSNNNQSNLNLPRNSRMKKNLNCCRICLSEEYETDNPLICPCKCSGTMKYIHIDCLRNWLKSKISSKNYTYMTSFTFKALECELCLMQFPLKIKTKTKTYDLLFTNIPDDSTYIILEQIVKEDQEKTHYLISFKEKNSLKVGRSNDSDIRLSDISISRYHANLIISDNNIYLDDNDSKFGSLLLLDSSVTFLLNQSLGLQIGKHFILMEINKTFISSICCNK